VLIFTSAWLDVSWTQQKTDLVHVEGPV